MWEYLHSGGCQRHSGPEAATGGAGGRLLVTTGEHAGGGGDWVTHYPLSLEQKEPLDWKGISSALCNRILLGLWVKLLPMQLTIH